ncbi:MAG: serB, partial [Paucimonas sp.]|nr:serB [Paucimonas sp.]
MNLILQGLDANRADVERIAGLAGSTSIDELSAAVYRCKHANPEARKQVDTECWSVRLDYAFAPEGQALSDFRVLAMDMDSTLITIECIDEIADMQGLKPQVAEIT